MPYRKIWPGQEGGEPPGAEVVKQVSPLEGTPSTTMLVTAENVGFSFILIEKISIQPAIKTRQGF